MLRSRKSISRLRCRCIGDDGVVHSTRVSAKTCQCILRVPISMEPIVWDSGSRIGRSCDLFGASASRLLRRASEFNAKLGRRRRTSLVTFGPNDGSLQSRNLSKILCCVCRDSCAYLQLLGRCGLSLTPLQYAHCTLLTAGVEWSPGLTLTIHIFSMGINQNTRNNDRGIFVLCF